MKLNFERIVQFIFWIADLLRTLKPFPKKSDNEEKL